MCTLTVIVPVHNSTGTLPRLLDTIFWDEDVQVILVDDRSDEDLEGLRSIVEKYGKRGTLQFYRNRTGRPGAGTARNIGLDQARGEWVLFADADDVLVEGAWNVLRPWLDSDCDVVFFAPDSRVEHTGKSAGRHLRYQGQVMEYLKNPCPQTTARLRYGFLVPWSKLIRRRVLVDHALRFDEVLASNDVMFSARLGACMERFDASSQVFYCVTDHPGSLIRKPDRAVFEARRQVYVRYVRYLKERLDPVSYQSLGLNGMHLLVKAVRFRLGWNVLVQTWKECRAQQIPLVSPRQFHPAYIRRKIAQIAADIRFR